jgi:hypothetical protein
MAFTCLIEFEPRGQHRLQRAVMKVLGDFAAVTPSDCIASESS